MDCAFCKNEEVKQRTIIENDFAFPTQTPIVRGYILVSEKYVILSKIIKA
jgi:hypothetical protein